MISGEAVDNFIKKLNVIFIINAKNCKCLQSKSLPFFSA
ncbi:hypothetical protein CLJ1_0360 [Pseudomonas paraeruginosa]|nr:hypothetical protein CLJ1_0360 [Pseudomonas aeruginosa]